MSYILDALRKAESERKLGSVPDLHAQTAAGAAFASRKTHAAPAWIIWSGLAALLTGALALAWYKPWQEPERPTTPLAPPAAAPAQLATVNPPATPQTPLPSQMPAQIPPTQVPPPAESAPRAVKPESRAPSTAAPQAVPRSAPSAKTPPPAVAVTEERIGAVRDLPEHIQRELPALTVGGYIYAKDPADRSMLINKRLLREGDDVGPGLKLEKMMPAEAVLNYRGHRYRIPYK